MKKNRGGQQYENGSISEKQSAYQQAQLAWAAKINGVKESMAIGIGRK